MRHFRHLLGQRAVIGRMLQAGLHRPSDAWTVPGPLYIDQAAAQPRALLQEYQTLVGGSLSAWGDQLVPHFFHRWAMPLILQTLEDAPVSLHHGLNAGCSLRIEQPVVQNQRLHLTAQLTHIDEQPKRTLVTITQKTTNVGQSKGLVATVRLIFPKSGTSSKRAAPRADTLIPHGARLLETTTVTTKTARRFCALTGDINPIHWLPIAARSVGFRNPILHGFCTLSIAWEIATKTLFCGDVNALSSIDVRFARPVVLPQKLSVFSEGDWLFVGSAPQAPFALRMHMNQGTDHV